MSTKQEKAAIAHKWSVDGFLESGRDHVGRILDNTKVTEAVDATILLGCGYFGAKTAQKLGATEPDAIFGGALTGMIGYKLATTLGGTPPISQIAGLGILGAIGVIDATHLSALDDITDFFDMLKQDVRNIFPWWLHGS